MKLEPYTPNKLQIDNLLRYCDQKSMRLAAPDGKPEWVPARPMSVPTMRERLAAARDVFTGKADALYWRGQ